MEKKSSEILEKIMNIRRLLKKIAEKQPKISFGNIDFVLQDFIDAYGDFLNIAYKNENKIIDIGVIDLMRVEFSIIKITDVLYNIVNSGPEDWVSFFTESYFLKNFFYRNIAGKFDVFVVGENEISDDKVGNYQIASQKLEESINSIVEKENSAERILKGIEFQKNQIDLLENNILAKQNSINSLEVNALSHATDVKNTLSKAVEESNRISELLISIEAINHEFENKKKEIYDLLENANKVGLARSFRERKLDLVKSCRLYFWVFLIGLSGLSALGYYEILPLLRIGSPDPTAIAARFLVGAPLVWLTWFGARQYGHNLRLREDYAFKEAAAMAFVGYRNDMSKDEAMLKLLQESAIKTFASNPLDAISKKEEAVSPIHELLEKSLSKLDPQKIVDSITALLKKDK